jgi:hypothetical protein
MVKQLFRTLAILIFLDTTLDTLVPHAGERFREGGDI